MCLRGRMKSPGGTPLYNLYRYAQPHRAGLCAVLAPHFAHFGLELGMAFEGTTGVYERIAGFQCHATQNRSK